MKITRGRSLILSWKMPSLYRLKLFELYMFYKIHKKKYTLQTRYGRTRYVAKSRYFHCLYWKNWTFLFTVEITTLSPGWVHAFPMRDRSAIVPSPCRYKLMWIVYGLTYEIQKTIQGTDSARSRCDHATY